MLPPQKTEFLSMSNSCFLAEKESFTHAEKCSSPLLQAVSSPIGKTKIHFFLKKKGMGTADGHPYSRFSSAQQTQNNYFVFFLMSIYLFIFSVLKQIPDLEITSSPDYSASQGQKVHRNLKQNHKV